MKWMQKTIAVLLLCVFFPFSAMAAGEPLPGTDPNSIFRMWKPPSLGDHLWKGRFGYAKQTFQNIEKFYAEKFKNLKEHNRRCLWAKILFTQASLYYDLTKSKNGGAVGKVAGQEVYDFFREKLRQSCNDKDDDGFKLFEEYKENYGDANSKWDLVRRAATAPTPVLPEEIRTEVQQLLQKTDEEKEQENVLKLIMLGILTGCASGGPVGCVL